MRPPRRPYDLVKRGIDVVAGIIGLVVTLPVQALVAVLVWRRLGRPVLFRQRRAGKLGRPFELVKFRTMLPINVEQGAIADEERITRLGTFLRSTSLDELPTLLNVVKGDMSLVGPRPLLLSYLDRYTSQQGRRHEVRPGITGLAQVSGRNAVSWERRFELDVDYVERRSLRLDFQILVRTVGAVFRREGVSAPGHVTMTEFLGSSPSDEFRS